MTISGWLNIDKPKGITSHDVVAHVRRAIRFKKRGHAGTLDPMATGVLVLCLGNATRLSEYAMHHTKTYEAVIHFGATTDTYDAEGTLTSTNAREVSLANLEAVMGQFVGDIQQVPPMYSAIKQGGKKLYELARAGQEVERPARAVTIHALEILLWESPLLMVRITCSAGTYIRSLAHDWGQAVGVGAYLTALTRTQSGSFTLVDAVPLANFVESAAEDTWQSYLLPTDYAVQDLPRLDLDPEAAKIVANGGWLKLEDMPTTGLIRAYAPAHHLLALLEPQADAIWKPHKVFHHE